MAQLGGRARQQIEPLGIAGRRIDSAARCALVTASIWLIIYGAFLSTGGHPADLLIPGTKGAGGDVVLQDFGPGVVPERYSFDGQQVYLIARYFPSLDEAADIVGGARMRMGRILLPALASPGGTGTTIVVLLGMWLIVGAAAGAYGLALALGAAGARAGRGVVFSIAAAPGMVSLTNEPLGFGLLFLGVGWWMHRRYSRAALALTLASLARETVAVFVIAIAIARWWRTRQPSEILMAASVLPAAAWTLFLRTFTDPTDPPIEALAFLSLDGANQLDLAGSVFSAGLSLFALFRWRSTVELATISAVAAAWFLIYHPSSFAFESITRLSMPGIALALAGWPQLRSKAAVPDGAPV